MGRAGSTYQDEADAAARWRKKHQEWERQQQFKKELVELIGRYSIDKYIGMSDHILAEHALDSLHTLAATQRRLDDIVEQQDEK